MKIVWEQYDIKPGRQIQKPDCGVTGRYIVGYRYDVDKQDCPTVYGLVSLADGMFTQFGSSGTKAQLAQHLNEAGYFLPVELLGIYDLTRGGA